jgi:hypothetical protein
VSSGDRVPEDGGVIEVHVRELAQLFDSMDPSPFHEKELDADAEDYIVGSAKELPGLVFLGACVAGGESIMRHMGERPLATALHESLLVGGWVAMWRPMEIFLYDWWPILSQRRLYDRLSRITVRLVYRRPA